MLEWIAKPFGWLMLHLYNWIGNYGVAVILFALVVKLILLPFQLKSKKSMMRMSRMTPRLKELEKKFGNDQQRYQQEMQKLYKEEGVNPMSGCLWSLLPYPILLALYRAIRFPLTTMMGVPAELLAEGGAIYEKLVALGYSIGDGAYEQIYQSQFITEHFSSFAGLSDKLQELRYNFLGLDLGQTPKLAFWNWDWSSVSGWLPALGLFMIPIVAAVLSWLSMKLANAGNPQAQAQAQQQKGMMLMMPIMSLWICFTMPAVMGIYWIAQYVFSMLQDWILTKIFNKQLDVEDADRIEREKAREAELEAKRQETERLKAAGATVENKNTSRKKKQAAAAQKEAERKAAEVRAAKAAARAARGEVDDTPPSQVGNRRYARGRAYVPDRYTNPDEAEEKTLAAAEESEAYAAEHPELLESAEDVTEAAEAEETAGEEEAADGEAEEIDGAEEAGEIEEAEEAEEAEETEESGEAEEAEETEESGETPDGEAINETTDDDTPDEEAGEAGQPADPGDE